MPEFSEWTTLFDPSDWRILNGLLSELITGGIPGCDSTRHAASTRRTPGQWFALA